jgi:hypothetical protein
MTSIPLNKTETTLLTEAAGRENGLLIRPETMKEVTFGRLIGKLLKHGLIAPREQDGAVLHHLTPAGYRAVGVKPPRAGRVRAAKPEDGATTGPAEAPKSTSKRDLVLGLLGRGEGASLDELIAATGWLPHTTRAALSRLRSSGQALVKSAREDGRTAYRIVMADESKPRKRAAQPPSGEQTEAVTG